jgi:hypothetical protein
LIIELAGARDAGGHTVNDSPQPQVRLTLGFTSLKPEDISSSA